jgi:hypothetical protein
MRPLPRLPLRGRDRALLVLMMRLTSERIIQRGEFVRRSKITSLVREHILQIELKRRRRTVRKGSTESSILASSHAVLSPSAAAFEQARG